MPRGTLEVVLVSAKGLDDNDFLSSIDPYVILTYRAQEKKSTVVKGGGSNPQWNETFLFTVSGSAGELSLRIMDQDNFSQDDFLGEAIIPLDAVIAEGSLPETAYNVVKDQEYCGEIKVALTFTAEPERYDDRATMQRRAMVDGENRVGIYKVKKGFTISPYPEFCLEQKISNFGLLWEILLQCFHFSSVMY